jgi:predicted DNA-binding antitoxin AbrB/MazE fold protein
MGVKAIYENDVLKPLEKLNLRTGQMNWWKARNWSRSDAG